MKLRSLIVTCIGDLRQCAKFILGDRANTDEFIVRFILLLSRKHKSLRSPITRIDLFRDFVATAMNCHRHEGLLSGQQHWNGLDVLTQRVAVFLSTSLGFRPSEIAYVLNISNEDALDLVCERIFELQESLRAEVLLIEDDRTIASDLCCALEALGHTVVGVARTKVEALEIFQSAKPNFLVADINLADGSSGIDAAVEISAKAPTPAVFVSSRTDIDTLRKMRDKIFIVPKPYQLKMITDAIWQARFLESPL